MPISPTIIRKLMKSRDMSAADLAKAMRMSAPNIYPIISGQRRRVEVDTAARLAEALGCLVDDLLAK